MQEWEAIYGEHHFILLFISCDDFREKIRSHSTVRTIDPIRPTSSSELFPFRSFDKHVGFKRVVSLFENHRFRPLKHGFSPSMPIEFRTTLC
jgi:hypothetical protein